jgi:hypothetical protein
MIDVLQLHPQCFQVGDELSSIPGLHQGAFQRSSQILDVGQLCEIGTAGVPQRGKEA